MLRVGVIGAGFIGKQHIESILRIHGVKIVAVADTNSVFLEQLLKDGVCERAYSDFNEMLALEQLDAIHNCTPTNMHYEVNKKAILKGIHVYSEKPLVKELSQAEELMRLLENKKLIFAVNFNYRTNLLVQEMHEQIRSEQFGRPLFVQGEYLQDWLMFESDYDWRMDTNIGGKSRALADIGSHCFDIMEFVLSKRIVSVNAQLFKVHKKRKKYEGVSTFSQVSNSNCEYTERDVENEDGGVIQALFEDGVVGSFTISQVSAGKKNGLKINVSGEKKAYEWKQEQSDRLWIGHRDKGNEEIYADAKYVSDYAKRFATLPNGHPVGWQDALTNGIRSFYEAVKNEDYDSEKPFATFADGYHIMKVVNACLESDEKKVWVDIQ